ncbi:AidA/PixA family protein [Xenorhabdus hominickii]|uniref:Methionine-rich PixA inclusion body protein n=1 Tax=Xenorhabdus hominickii TaxID=351679 RepID=A0A2G0Q065_XENHO|nr:AidA/PixA family protein [Xenorhabdus hominickii]AOM42749.1 hypothetical protein A9255_20710 [Xenorhabdus hominickii]PHM52596.1 methionine-rich PixA inclusion body protein [Xenorhabdus hominickii]
MKHIDVLISVKAEEIMNDYGKLSTDIMSPVPIYPSGMHKEYVRVLSEDESLASVDKDLNIMVKADIDDVIRWNVATLNINSIYSAAVMKIMPMHMKTMMHDGMVNMIDMPVMKHMMKFLPSISMHSPVDVDMQKVKDYCWEAKINELPVVGQLRTMYYHCIIGIYREMSLMGYVVMEPSIILSNDVM